MSRLGTQLRYDLDAAPDDETKFAICERYMAKCKFRWLLFGGGLLQGAALTLLVTNVHTESVALIFAVFLLAVAGLALGELAERYDR